jgi:hypothetical protein
MHFVDGLRLHDDAIELRIQNYILKGDGSLDSHAQVGFSDGWMFDEDIDFDIAHSASPTDYFEQVLASQAEIPMFYRDGASGAWRRQDATTFPVISPAGVAKYNLDTAGTWSLANVPNENFFITWIFATNDVNHPVVGVVGRQYSGSVADLGQLSVHEIIDDPTWPFKEAYSLYRLIWKHDTTYTNTPKVSLFIADTKTLDPAGAEDRWPFLVSYNGNVGQNKYLQVFPGQGSDTQPFTFVEPGFIRSIVLQTIASNTGTIGIYKMPDLVTPVFSIGLTADTLERFELSQFFDQDDQIAFRVDSGSFNKPGMFVYVQTEV